MKPADAAPTFDTFATKADIARLEEKMATRADLYRALWMQTGVIVGAVIAVAAIARLFG